ncbi:hypothetical protein BaRGS_00031961, partial [Batillaria attramentaria]
AKCFCADNSTHCRQSPRDKTIARDEKISSLFSRSRENSRDSIVTSQFTQHSHNGCCGSDSVTLNARPSSQNRHAVA